MFIHTKHKKLFLTIVILALIIGTTLWATRYLALFQTNDLQPGQPINIAENTPTNPDQPTDQTLTPIDYEIKQVTNNLMIPWAIAFTSPDRMLITERPGRIRELTLANNIWELKINPLITFPEVSANAEEGLMGLTKDPNYDNNFYLYACLAYPKGNQIVDKVIRFIDPISMSVENPQPPQEILLDNIPAARYHAGCELTFGPDQKLYITTGDATDKQIAQDLDNLGGKILRMNPDGTIPIDNPFPNSLVYSYGHRNPQGIDFHPTTGQIWSTEHGPSVFDGPAGGDEINLIKAGRNYGWPLVSHEDKKDGTIAPKLLFTPAIAPGSLIVYDGEKIPQWSNNLIFAALKGEGLIRATINQETITSYELIDLKNLSPGRIREVIVGPDGNIYFTTSNQDGRGTLRTRDDKIYAITPVSL